MLKRIGASFVIVTGKQPETGDEAMQQMIHLFNSFFRNKGYDSGVVNITRVYTITTYGKARK